MKSVMKKVRKVILVTVVIVVILMVIILAWGIKRIIDGNMEVSDAEQSLSASVSVDASDVEKTSETTTKKEAEEHRININSKKLNWYSSLNEAMEDTSLIKDSYFFGGYDKNIDNMITEVKNDSGEDYVIYINSVGGGMVLFYAGVYYKDGKYSQPYDIGDNFIDYTHSGGYKYNFDDNVSQELTMEYALGPQIIAENGNQVFYGSWGDKKEIESMTIDGNKPDKIIPYFINGREQYYWYYTQTDLAAKLKTIDYSNYTLQQVTDLIGIKYELDTSVEKAKDKY